ncbi:GNAT family N-acetyltransferase [Nocardioides sp. NPDC101246]|uniref:GNAT family N-acetyltransferase n=1 Tax=Nocardioides sp. NPDC101246 TaxID=3364336 RepID=UPI0037F67CDC
MTTPKPTPSARKTELLEAAYAYALEHGLADLSLRPVAAAIGSSPRVLMFLFGNKDGLVKALLVRARVDELAMIEPLPSSAMGLPEAVTHVWAWLAAEEHRPLLRLWVEAYARSLVEPDGPWAGFAESTVNDWLALLAASQPEPERTNPDGEARRTLALATLRGALLDLLATGDVERVTAAVELQAGSFGRTTPAEQQHPVIRPAAGADLGDLQSLARRVIDTCYRGFLGDEAVDWFIGSGASDEHVATHLEQGGVYCLVQDGRIIGLSILDGTTVDLMMIDPERQGQGLGRLLLRHAEDTLLAQHPTIRLETFSGNTRAMSFYDACGWVLGERLEGEGPDKVEYLKSRTADPVPASTLT